MDEEVLQEQLRRMVGGIIEIIPDGVAAYDQNGHIIYANYAAEKILGLPRDRIIGQTYNKTSWKVTTVDGEPLPERDYPFTRIMEEREPIYVADYAIERPDGRRLIVSSHAVPVGEKNGSPIGMVEAFTDITERGIMDDELRFRSLLLNSVTDSVFVLNLSGEIIYVNEAAYKDRQYTREELLSMRLEDIDTPENVKLIKPRIESLLKEGSIKFESAHFRKDGSAMPVEVYARVIEHKGENVIVSIARDIANRKRAEEALRESEKMLREITSVLGEGVYVLDKLGRLTFMNPEAERLLGWTEEELLGKDMHEAIHYQTAEGVRIPASECAVIQVTKKGGIYRTEDDVFTRKDGTIFPVAYVCTPIKRDGEIVGSVTAFQDVSQRKRAEQLSNALNEINTAINLTLEFGERAQKIVTKAAVAVGSETASIELREGDHWVVSYLYGLPKETIGIEFTDEEALHLAIASETKSPVVINNPQKDERINRDLVESYNIRSIMVVPLIAGENVIGAMCFSYHTESIPFTDVEIDFASKLAASVSLALENARLYETERNIADMLQESLLIMPNRLEGIDFGYLYHSATEAAKVGGDFYDIFELEHGKIGVIIGDISGKGIEATVFIPVVKNTIKAHAYEGGTPALIMAKTNDLLLVSSPAHIFVTAFFGVLDVETGDLTYCSAGHPPAIIKRASGGVELLARHSPIIGAFSRMHYRSAKSKLRKGDILILYTDGIIESRSNGEFYGEDRLIEFIENMKQISASKVQQTIFDQVSDFTGGRLQDDIAVLAISLKDS